MNKYFYKSTGLLAFFLLFPLVGHASFVTQSYTESNSSFSLVLDGNEINFDDIHSIGFGSFWTLYLSIDEDQTLSSDELTITGTARHLNAPHGEAPGTIFNFSFFIDSDLFSSGGHAATNQVGLFSHESDDDSFTAKLSFVTDGGGFFNTNITNYHFELDGVHTGVGAAVPLPASFWLMLSGVSLMFGFIREGGSPKRIRATK